MKKLLLTTLLPLAVIAGSKNVTPVSTVTPISPIEAKSLVSVYVGALGAECCNNDFGVTSVFGIEYGDAYRVGFMYTWHKMSYLYGKYILNNGLYAKLGIANRSSCTKAMGAIGTEGKYTFIEVNTAEQVIAGVRF